MTQDLPLYNRLKKNLKKLKPFLKQNQISCFRVYDWDMPEYPLCIDIYEKYAHIAEYKTRFDYDLDANAKWIESCKRCVSEVFQIKGDHIYVKLRKRGNSITQYEKVDQNKQFIKVQENGLNFLVNLSDYIDTGLFLDHRVLRKKVMMESEGKSVLNLFAYTGSFSVYAAAGGAKYVNTIDLSNTYLNWAKENFLINNIELKRHSFEKSDVKEWLKQTPRRTYDIIVLDPPTISKSKMAKSKFDVQADHVELINNALRHIKPDGVLYFSNNYRGFKLDESNIMNTIIEDISLATIPEDFRNKLIHYCWRLIKKKICS